MITWIDGYLLPSDSIWSLMQKLGWMNEYSPADLLDELFGMSSRPGATLALDTADWLRDLHWTGAAGSELRVEGLVLAAALSRRPEPRFSGQAAVLSAQLQTCPRCLKFGYHAWWHQLRIMKRCAFHGGPLTVGCPTCHRPAPYALQAKARPYGCPRCCGYFGKRTLWLGVAPGVFQSVVERLDGSIQFWGRRAQRVVAHVADTPYRSVVARDGNVDPSTVAAWLTAEVVEPPFARECLGRVPSGCFAHKYVSCEGELIRIDDSPPSSQQASFALSVSDLTDQVAALMREELGRDHPCLLGDETESAPKYRQCPVVLGFQTWRKQCLQLADDIAAAAGVDSSLRVTGNLHDVAGAMMSEMYRAMHCAIRARFNAPRQSARDAAFTRRALARRLFPEWCSYANRAPVASVVHVRPELDHRDWIAAIPCAYESPG